MVVCYNGLILPAQIRKGNALVEPGQGIARVDLEGLVVCYNGLILPAQIRKGNALVEPGQGIARVDLEGLVVCYNGLILPAQIRKGNAFVVPGQGIARVDAYGLIVSGKGRAVVSSRRIDQPTTEGAGGRLVLGDLLEDNHCLIIPPQYHILIAQVRKHLGRAHVPRLQSLCLAGLFAGEIQLIEITRCQICLPGLHRLGDAQKGPPVPCKLDLGLSDVEAALPHAEAMINLEGQVLYELGSPAGEIAFVDRLPGLDPPAVIEESDGKDTRAVALKAA